MPTAIDTAAPTGEDTIIKVLDDIKAMDSIDKSSAMKSALNLKDLPQDARSPFSPTVDETPRDDGNNNYNAQGSPAVAGNIHAWVSPNKSDEVPSSKESSPDVSNETSLPSSKESSPESFHLNITAISNANKENPDVPPLGLADVSSTAMTDALVFDASNKDWIKIVHGGKEVMVMLHNVTLIASLGITKEIVGLKSTGTLFTEDGSSMFKEHGDIIIPFSRYHPATMDSVPSFELVTADLDSFLEENNQGKLSWKDTADASVFSDETSQGNESSGLHESMLYTDAFIELMNSPKEFNAMEKNALLRFGVDNADSNVLFRAAFRVAVYAENMSFFIKGLKDIASVLIGGSSDEEAMLLMEEGAAKKSAKTIFGLSEFVIATDELYECNDITTGQYATLLHAIFSDDEDIERLFDLYQNPDFLVACENENQRCSLMLLDSNDSDDTLLKWAIHTGVHNFAASNSDVPKEFFSIMYHMFSSGDELILEACKDFVDSNDAEVMDNMIEREWSIYCKNNQIVPKADATSVAEESEEELETVVEHKGKVEVKGKDKEIPEVLTTACSCLTELNDVTANEAAAILASYAKGNQVVADVYETYMQDGDTDTFLSMLRVIAPTLAEHEEEDSKQLLREAFQHFVEDESFRAVDLAALRLAAVRKDKLLISFLLDFKNDDDVDALKVNLLTVAADTIVEFTDDDTY
ncbi:hypothetical protein QTG54_014567 [Skeletonema marinoi]|uniref:Uncharacterized protein n=1 Tax=Skeletonema marinoi TaxID=267567 RepID=A0AAD8XVL7_9STRA|nr:hypothetical protein QTG54_014567 [Skeletonema marinoi]